MQAVLNRIENNTANLIGMLQKADNNSKNEIENKIVKMGAFAIEDLIDALKSLKGIARGIAAMSLIRIGEDSIVPLKREAMKDSEFAWVADYLISEIDV